MNKNEAIKEIKKIIKQKAIIVWYGWAFIIALLILFVSLFFVFNFKIIYIVFAFISLFGLPHIAYSWYRKSIKFAIKKLELEDDAKLWTNEDIFYLMNYQRKMVFLPPKKIKTTKK